MLVYAPWGTLSSILLCSLTKLYNSSKAGNSFSLIYFSLYFLLHFTHTKIPPSEHYSFSENEKTIRFARQFLLPENWRIWASTSQSIYFSKFKICNTVHMQCSTRYRTDSNNVSQVSIRGPKLKLVEILLRWCENLRS